MRIKDGFTLRKVCGQDMVIAEGKENIDFSNIISLNESAALLWRSVEGKDFTTDDLARILTENYELEGGQPLPEETALHDANDIANKWIEAGIVAA